MLYRDYSRKQDEWIPNVYGARENLDAMIGFLHFGQRAHSTTSQPAYGCYQEQRRCRFVETMP